MTDPNGAVELEVEAGRSRSITIPIGRLPSVGSTGSGTVDLSVDYETRHVDMAIGTAERGLFLTISPAEAKLWGLRLMQAGEALE